ncbi:MAG: hypothetical protein KUG71_05015 [Porticoccaceae bacterium]|nr:hypothetical protein [Porticoccaceae bacterium]
MNSSNNKIGSAIALALMLIAGLLLSACTKQSPNHDPAALAKNAVDQAQTKYQASEQAAYAWVPAKVALTLATGAFEAGDMETALIEAERATMLTEASLAQAKVEQNAWLERFPKPPASTTETREKP